MPQSLYSQIERVLLRVKTPGQYAGGEVNMAQPDWSDQGRVRFALAFPDTYAIGMSNQGFKILYHLVNSQKDMLCERAFSPWLDMETIMREKQIPAFSLENHYPLKDFDAIGFSLQNETSYSNLLNILDLAEIPLEAIERSEDQPIIIAGGTGAVTPEPIADFVDVFFLGEGEEILPCFLRLLGAWRGRMTVAALREALAPCAGKDDRRDLYAQPPLGLKLEFVPDDISALDRHGFLELCAKVLPGCYVPSLYDIRYDDSGTIEAITPLKDGVSARIKKNATSNLNGTYYPIQQILPYVDTIHDRVTIEVMRGCTEGCRYCQAGMIDRPQRYRTPEKVVGMAREIVEKTGYDEVALLSLSSSDHPQLFEIMDQLREEFDGEQVSVSLPSLRVNDQLQKLPQLTKGVRRTGLTMAPESGSERLRRVINKNITQEDLLRGAEVALREGWRTIKFYFMIGLPTENDQDIRDTAKLVNEVAVLARSMGKRPTINVTVSLFVPKAFTPFQWEAMATQEELEHRRRLLLSLVEHRSIKLKFHGYGESWLESLLSRGDRRLGRVVRRAWELGARFDAWKEGFKREIWDQALSECGLDPAFYIHRLRTKDEILPWDMLSVGTNKKTLWDERVRSRLEQFTQDCSGHTPGCLACGVDPLTCRTGIDQPEDEMNAQQQKRSKVRYAPVFKERQQQREELVNAAHEFGLL